MESSPDKEEFLSKQSTSSSLPNTDGKKLKMKKVISIDVGDLDETSNIINSDFNRTSVFTNEVVIIRPKTFYENREAH